MIKEEFHKLIFNKIPQNAKVAIFGASNIGLCVYNDILKRKDIKVPYFIDNYKTGFFHDVPIIGLYELVEKRKEIDIVVITSLSAREFVANILDIYDIPYIAVNQFVFDIYNGNHLLLNDNNYNKIRNIFAKEEDKNLFDIIFKVRRNIIPREEIESYYSKKYAEEYPIIINPIKKQYFDRINVNAVKTIFDVGFNSGFNAIAAKHLLPNYEKIYAFEACYEYCRDKIVEQFVMDDSVIIVNYALGEKKEKTQFCINLARTQASFAQFSSNKKQANTNYKEITVDVTTIDDYCKENNVKPDFIKMDIEGAEMFAIRGGIETIKSTRPQLAISIYHSDNDFINIPLYLYENLKNYTYRIAHYTPYINETVFYAIPNELA